MKSLKYKIEQDHVVVTGCAKDIHRLRIPEKIDGYPVKVIGKNAFCNHECLKSIVLPRTIERIEAGAFKNCRNLSRFELPSEKTVFEGMNVFMGARYSMEEYLKMTECQVISVEFQDDED